MQLGFSGPMLRGASSRAGGDGSERGLESGAGRAGSASGTLGQIIPPSIVLVLIGDIVGVSVGDLFMGAVFPGLLLVRSSHFHIQPHSR